MPSESRNFHFHITTEDGNELAKRLGQMMSKKKHYLLVYDPYDATINWEAIMPFVNGWSEVVLNHMVSDSMRAVKMVKRDEAKAKYEQTYLMELKDLIPYGSDKDAYEERIEKIVKYLRYKSSREYFVAAFPFFNEKNAIVYNLIHCTGNIEGFKLYKKSAWKTFGGKSSTKDTHGREKQLTLDLEGTGEMKTYTDEYCYYVKDIADYLQNIFRGQSDVPLSSLWEALDEHPIFPSDGFRPQIKEELKHIYGAHVGRKTVSFAGRR
jgi:hypothetical protein